MNLSQWTIAVIGFSVFAWHERHGPWTPLRMAGVVICFAGLVLVTVARYQLGRAFSLKAKAQRLVTTGLYARMRNPIYVFAEVFAAGIALWAQSWWPIFFLLAVIPLQVWRARNEAAVLEAAFGEEYRHYRERTWF